MRMMRAYRAPWWPREFRSVLLLALLVIGMLTSPDLARSDNKMKTMRPNPSIPQGCFLFGGYNIETGEMILGQRGSEGSRNGGHCTLQQKLTAKAPIPGRGQGKVVGFGIYREGNIIYLHRFCSMKAAGSSGSVDTVNPLLPCVNPEHPAMVPAEYAQELFTKLALDTDCSLEVDNDMYGSKRYTFNVKKQLQSKDALKMDEVYGPGSAARQIEVQTFDATYWLDGVVDEANADLLEKRWGKTQLHLASGMYVPPEAWMEGLDTLYPDYELENPPNYSKAVSVGKEAYIELNPEKTRIESPCEKVLKGTTADTFGKAGKSLASLVVGIGFGLTVAQTLPDDVNVQYPVSTFGGAWLESSISNWGTGFKNIFKTAVRDTPVTTAAAAPSEETSKSPAYTLFHPEEICAKCQKSSSHKDHFNGTCAYLSWEGQKVRSAIHAINSALHPVLNTHGPKFRTTRDPLTGEYHKEFSDPLRPGTPVQLCY